ncbi:CKLF-like MARVEL transmembrane domain-containing protein 7 isoform X1 [Centrocercus urophasianus]|uniref:CKLF-like MARVEL transmembrane domain-containing protein 7 isoform X1 n=1 Tax=Centrocercus urophasianus TaxID=9002 RepID=UPI001C64F89F|nr:CKLF-like MARVEL transmembrane domain-containing protein 7 isoform X1 [Centrocercus urophasianus]
MCDLVMILFFYIIHIFRIYRTLTCVSWPLAEFLHYLIGTILLLIASIVAASKSYNLTGLVAGATFGFLATVLCVLSIWSSYKVSCITQSTMKLMKKYSIDGVAEQLYNRCMQFRRTKQRRVTDGR